MGDRITHSGCLSPEALCAPGFQGDCQTLPSCKQARSTLNGRFGGCAVMLQEWVLLQCSKQCCVRHWYNERHSPADRSTLPGFDSPAETFITDTSGVVNHLRVSIRQLVVASSPLDQAQAMNPQRCGLRPSGADHMMCLNSPFAG